MLNKKISGFLDVSVFLLAVLSAPAWGQVSVLTQHNDNSRSGTNSGENILNTSNVNVSTFGKLFTSAVDGYIFAQPLYVPSLIIAGATHNVVYVATAADSVFAFDADNGTQLWKKNFGTPVPSSVISTQNILVQVGIISTPVIAAATQTMYFVTKTYESQTQIFRLHAIDITTGNEKFGGPVQISAVVNGTGEGSDVSGHLAFQASQENQRTALALANGTVYLAFASHEDFHPYHGWVLGYSSSTLQQLYVFNLSPNGSAGGIWQSGQGPVIDANNNLYFVVGNGTTDVQTGGTGYGEAFIKLNSALVPQDYFVPNNFDTLNASDQDVGSSGPVAIGGTNYIAGEGKQGVLYVVDTTNMGQYNASADSIHQEFQTGSGIWGSPIFWNNPGSPSLFVWSNGDHLKAFPLTNGLFATSPAAQSAIVAPAGAVGGALSISSNQYAAGSNILWASIPLQDPDHATVPGQLIAFDASNVGTELWDSHQNQSRDDVGSWAKFVAPTVANGKVYMASDSGQLVVYGLLPPLSQTETAVDDAVAGAVDNQFNYFGAWGHCTNCGGPTLYAQSNSWDNVVNDYFTVSFNGTQIKFYGVQDPRHGIGAVSIDGGGETNIDFYASTRAGDVLLWSSPVVQAGKHVFKLRVLGTHDASSTDSYAVADHVDILTGSPVSAPTGLTATGQSSSILLSWNASSAAQYYDVYRGTIPGGEGAGPIGSPASTTFTDTNAIAGTTYYYTVAAVSATGTSAQSNEASAAVGAGAVLADGTYNVISVAQNLVLDDPANSSALGTNVILWPANGGNNQKWSFTSVGNGYYTITNLSNGLALDDPAFSTASGTQLVQWSLNGGINQLWLVAKSGSGFTIKNQSSGLAVDGASGTQGTNIVQAAPTGQSNQTWLIQ